VGLGAPAGSAAGVDTTAPPTAAAVQEAVDACMARQRRLAIAQGADLGGGRFVAAAVELVAPLLQSRVLAQLVQRSALLLHVGAMHRYQLLTAGDFASVLIAGIAPELDKPATSTAIARHSLEAVLESAIRGSNAAREEDEVLRRLSVRILPPSPGETGWDVFALQYDLPPPLLTVVTSAARAEYGRLFHYLFRLKRLEHALAATWAAHMTASHALRTARHGGLNRILHMCHLLRGDMTNFIANTMSYIMFEVLAAALSDFRDAVHAATSVHDVTAAHAALLATITAHCLVDAPTLAALVGECLRFCALQQSMVAAALQAVQDRRVAEAAMAARTAAGGWGIPAGVEDLDALDDRLSAALDALVASYGPRIARIAREYRTHMAALVATG
jgi:gamma-tubulin complex component 3